MKHYKKSVYGFTLVELAIVILIGGLFLSAIGHSYKIYMEKYFYNVNNYRLQQTRDSILLFQAGAGRLPCPADATLDPSDAGYGWEVCPPAGVCAPGIECVDGRDVDGDGTPERVLIGAVPHNSILDLFENGPFADTAKFPDFAAYSVIDAYRTKLRYAVTEGLTSSSLYSFFNPAPSNIGAIFVTDEFDESIIHPEGSGQFVVFSHGENGVGGYSREGTRNMDCVIPSGYTGSDPGYVPGGAIPPGVNSSSIETDKENCDDNDAIFILGSRSMADNSSYYDDTLYYVNVTSQEIWRASLLSGGMAWYNTNAGNVGMGVEVPQAKLHIGDSSGANEGDINALSLRADKFCDNLGGDCMDPRAIGGELPQMTCPNSYEAVIAIENNSVICAPVITALPTASCPPGEYLAGVSNLGNIHCAVPP